MSCKSTNTQSKVSAVIFDLDGTLLDTERVTKNVLKEFLAKYGKELNKEKRSGMTMKESAVAIVENYNLPITPDQFIAEITPMYRKTWLEAKALPGAMRLIKHLHRNGVPLALASNSIREYIDTKISHQQGWKECFSVIIGSDEVKSGKPSPDLFLEAARRMGVDEAHCLVIEDSMIGVRAAKAANMKIVAVPSQKEADCSSLADSVLHSLLEFQPNFWGLPPFEDWIDNTLPIVPIQVSCLHVNGPVYEVTEIDSSSLPDQVWGDYFGWVTVEDNITFKIVVSFDGDCSAPKRKIQLCLIDESGVLGKQRIQLLLVGYIRRISGKGNMSAAVLKEVKSVANASLDHPAFAINDSYKLNMAHSVNDSYKCK